MKNLVFIIIFIISFSSCKSSKVVKDKNTSTSRQENVQNDTDNTLENHVAESETLDNSETSKSIAENIIDYAIQFEGVRYKWGGTTDKGMDCSGLVYESFRAYDITLPRISRDMAKKGEKIVLKDVLRGDLLFFKTGNRRNAINHVGLIVDIRDNDIKFIHATTNNGVIISGLNETYWLKAFFEARRIL